MAVSSLPQDAIAAVERARLAPPRGSRRCRRCSARSRTRPHGLAVAEARWPSSGRAISSPSATWTRATGRPRSPAARSSATRCCSIALLSNIMAILLQALCARLGIATGRDLAQACRDAFPRAVSLAALGARRDRDLRHRPRRGDRHRDRPQPAVRHSARDRRAHHRARRVPDPVAAEHGLPLDRGLHHHAARRHRGLLRDADRDGRSGLGRGDRGLRADDARSSPIRTCSTSRSASSARR